MQRATSSKGMAGLILAGVLGAAMVGSWANPAQAQRAAGLEGSWSGGGRVIFPSGDSERARCRATFRRQAGSTYSMNATCATSSARIAQVASVRKVGAGNYAGRFRNAEYDVSGAINITLRGDRLAASLSGGGGGSARLSLTR